MAEAQAVSVAIDPVSNILQGAGAVGKAVGGIIGLLKANPTIKLQGEQDLEKTALVGQIQAVLGQLAIDLEEAKSPNWWVAGWRPYIGWVCGTGLLYAWLLKPFIQTLLVVFHSHFDPAQLPVLSTVDIIAMAGNLLGIGTMRTVEKFQGVADLHK